MSRPRKRAFLTVRNHDSSFLLEDAFRTRWYIFMLYAGAAFEVTPLISNGERKERLDRTKVLSSWSRS